MKLYGVPLSVHTRKVQLVLRAKEIDHDLQVVIPIVPDTLPENWGQLSPSGLIPVLEGGDFTLPDSGAIIQYLDSKHPDTPVIPADSQMRGRTLWLEAYLGAFFRDVMHPLFHQRVVAQMRGATPDNGIIDHVLSSVAPRFFDYLEGEASGEYLVGDTMTVADISVGSNLVLFHYLGETLSAERYPALSIYFGRLLKTRAFVEQLEAEVPFTGQMGFSQAGLAA
ncbi:glutathione S-transferase family protein [Roseibium sp. M-1]